MARARTSFCLLTLAALWLAAVNAAVASDDSFKVIVRSDNPVGSVNHDFLRNVFLKKAVRWGGGMAARPIDLARDTPVRDRFGQEVLGKTPAQLRSYWIQRIFSGTDMPPPEAKSVAAAIAYVAANPGAIGYVPSAADCSSVKVVQVR